MQRLLDAVARYRVDDVAIAAWSLCVTRSRRLSLGVKDGQAGNAHHPLKIVEARGARYRLIWEDGRISRGHFERRQLESDVEEALRTARRAAYDDPDAAWVLGPAGFPEVELHDAETALAAGGAPGATGPRLSAVRRRVGELGFRTWSASFSAAETESRVVTSAGLDASSTGTSYNWHVNINGEIGSGFSGRRGEPTDEFEARVERLMHVARLLERDAGAMDGGVLPVLLHPRVVEGFILETMLGNLGGASLFHGEGWFRREQIGAERPVLRDDLTLRIDPLVPMRSGSYRFTAEGLPAAPCVFLERGRLVSPVLDLKYARRLGLPPTPLPLAMDTLFLEGPPILSLDEALARSGHGALVLAVLGAHTQDRGSGEFSLSAPQVLRILDGKFAGRIRATISGNLFDLLRGEDLERVRFEGEHTPGLLLRCRIDPK